jgi:DeoR family transcriptional regulator of aga operon
MRAIEAHFADHAAFSVRGLTRDGHLTDPDPLEAEVKRAMIDRARQVILLVDGSKLDRPALTEIATVDRVSVILAADAEDGALRRLQRAGIDVRPV